MHSRFKLNTGATIPAVGFGTFDAKDGEIYDAVLTALKVGYRHLDCAYYYQNEGAIGRAIRDSGIARAELFITTKMWPTQAQNPAAALDKSLEALGLEYVDLYLVHWPVATVPDPEKPFSWGLKLDKDLDHIKIWAKFQTLPTSKARALGVSNFTTLKLGALLAAPSTKLTPAVNQCELHPELQQERLVKYCKEHDIVLEAYCPLARGQLDSPTLVSIAQKHGVDAAQVALSWNVQRGVVVLPKSVTSQRIESNLKVIELDEEDLKLIATLRGEKKRGVDPAIPGVMEDIYDGNVDA